MQFEKGTCASARRLQLMKPVYYRAQLKYNKNGSYRNQIARPRVEL